MQNSKNFKRQEIKSKEVSYEPENCLELQDKLGYQFNDQELLLTAITHLSYANEKDLGYDRCYEKLEFLGDSVLQLVISDYLFKNNLEFREGKLTRFRSQLVSEENLSCIASELNLGQYIFLSKGEYLNNGREKISILADIVESIIGAIYLDSFPEKGMDVIKDFVLKLFGDKIKTLDKIDNIQDSRSLSV